MTEEIIYHTPVLLEESVNGMNIRPDGTYVDVTFGGGGHSKYILSKLGKNGRLLSFDVSHSSGVTSAICITFYVTIR